MRQCRIPHCSAAPAFGSVEPDRAGTVGRRHPGRVTRQ